MGEGLFTRLDCEDAITALEIMTECYYLKKAAETSIKSGGTVYTMEGEYKDE